MHGTKHCTLTQYTTRYSPEYVERLEITKYEHLVLRAETDFRDIYVRMTFCLFYVPVEGML
jgi:hypothetical protein